MYVFVSPMMFDYSIFVFLRPIHVPFHTDGFIQCMQHGAQVYLENLQFKSKSNTTRKKVATYGEAEHVDIEIATNITLYIFFER